MLSSVLLVPGSQPARLEDMSFTEPGVWLRTHTVCCEGRTLERQAGAKVGPLGCSWREVRRQHPELFTDGKVLLWLQPEATEDEVICSFLSLQAQSEARQCIIQVDMFKGEHTDCVRSLNFLSQQAKHTIGMHQTSQLQLVDVRFSPGWARCSRQFLPPT